MARPSAGPLGAGFLTKRRAFSHGRHMLTIAIANEKGGVGKTTTSVALADLYANAGSRVLVVDLDPQGSATQHLLGKPARDDGEGLLRALGGTKRMSQVARRCRCIRNAWVAPAGNLVANATHLYREKVAGGQRGLRTTLAAEKDKWDVVLLDCPPKSPFLLTSALVAADFVLLPTELAPSAIRGLTDFTHRINEVRETLNPDLLVAGILPTRVMTQRRITNEIYHALQNDFGELVYNSYIREDAAVVESDGRAKPVTRRSASRAAEDYRDAHIETCARIDNAQAAAA